MFNQPDTQLDTQLDTQPQKKLSRYQKFEMAFFSKNPTELLFELPLVCRKAINAISYKGCRYGALSCNRNTMYSLLRYLKTIGVSEEDLQRTFKCILLHFGSFSNSPCLSFYAHNGHAWLRSWTDVEHQVRQNINQINHYSEKLLQKELHFFLNNSVENWKQLKPKPFVAVMQQYHEALRAYGIDYFDEEYE